MILIDFGYPISLSLSIFYSDRHTFDNHVSSILLIPEDLHKSYGFPIFLRGTYLMKVSPEMRPVHYIELSFFLLFYKMITITKDQQTYS